MVKEDVWVVPVLVAEVAQVIQATLVLDRAVGNQPLLEVSLCYMVQELRLPTGHPLAELAAEVAVLSRGLPSVELVHKIVGGANVDESPLKAGGVETTAHAAESSVLGPQNNCLRAQFSFEVINGQVKLQLSQVSVHHMAQVASEHVPGHLEPLVERFNPSMTLPQVGHKRPDVCR